jgi:tRNA pseudouridine38-40 synthase
MRIAIKFAYNGRVFNGYARQPKLKTVEGNLIDSLVKSEIIVDPKISMFRSASRTDKGVSALGNVVAFNTNVSKNKIKNELFKENHSIVIYGIKEVNQEFYPRHAKSRQYRYFLKSNDLDIKKIITISNCFTGKHNFSNFAKLESFKDPIRKIENIIFTFENDLLKIDFFAQTFLWHQIRKIISALIKIGNDKLEKTQICEALENPDKKVDFGLAHAEPLILKDIFYDFEFEVNKNQKQKSEKIEKEIISSLN